jgi:hypothetical protein
MRHSPFLSAIALAAFLVLGISHPIQAGPPFFTDDPEPVELHHWEINFGTMDFHSSGDWNGFGPLLEVNYGAIEDVQLHIIAPFAYDKPSGEHGHYGYGDTELGIKYRFLHLEDKGFSAGLFPLVELPTGNHDQGLGNGKTQLFIPLWLQQEWGKWTTYGGGGYWFNPGYDNNRNYWFMGWELQRKITDAFTVGAEIYHTTSQTEGESSQTNVGLGIIWDLSETYHIIASAGHSVQGPSEFQGYFALQITLGPEEKKSEKSPAHLITGK